MELGARSMEPGAWSLELEAQRAGLIGNCEIAEISKSAIRLLLLLATDI